MDPHCVRNVNYGLAQAVRQNDASEVDMLDEGRAQQFRNHVEHLVHTGVIVKRPAIDRQSLEYVTSFFLVVCQVEMPNWPQTKGGYLRRYHMAEASR